MGNQIKEEMAEEIISIPTLQIMEGEVLIMTKAHQDKIMRILKEIQLRQGLTQKFKNKIFK